MYRGVVKAWSFLGIAIAILFFDGRKMHVSMVFEIAFLFFFVYLHIGISCWQCE